MRLKTDTEALPLPVISDGIILKESLEALEITENDIMKILKKEKTEVSSVFLMTLDRFKNANIINMRDKK